MYIRQSIEKLISDMLQSFYMNGNMVPHRCRKAFEGLQEAAMHGYGLAMKDPGRYYLFAKEIVGSMRRKFGGWMTAVFPDSHCTDSCGAGDYAEGLSYEEKSTIYYLTL